MISNIEKFVRVRMGTYSELETYSIKDMFIKIKDKVKSIIHNPITKKVAIGLVIASLMAYIIYLNVRAKQMISLLKVTRTNIDVSGKMLNASYLAITDLNAQLESLKNKYSTSQINEKNLTEELGIIKNKLVVANNDLDTYKRELAHSDAMYNDKKVSDRVEFEGFLDNVNAMIDAIDIQSGNMDGAFNGTEEVSWAEGMLSGINDLSYNLTKDGALVDDPNIKERVKSLTDHLININKNISRF